MYVDVMFQRTEWLTYKDHLSHESFACLYNHQSSVLQIAQITTLSKQRRLLRFEVMSLHA